MTQARALEEARELKSILDRWWSHRTCSIELLPGRGSDPWAVPSKYLRMHHHTAAPYRGVDGNLTPALGIVKEGRPDVIGPLANGYGGFDLRYRILCMGLANHPGAGGPITIDGVRVPKDSARGPTWGTEWEGGLQDYETIPGMMDFMAAIDCGLAEYGVLGEPRLLTSQLEHSTWAPDRKIDRRNFTRTRGIALTTNWFNDHNPNKEWLDMVSEAEFKDAMEMVAPATIRVAAKEDPSPANVYYTDLQGTIYECKNGGPYDNLRKSLLTMQNRSTTAARYPQSLLDEMMAVFPDAKQLP